jgi:hypothetical protein
MAVRPMSSAPRSPSEHYVEATRLLAAAESSVTDGIQQTAALCAIGHALLAQAPRRARKAPQQPARHGGSPQTRWALGEDGGEQ